MEEAMINNRLAELRAVSLVPVVDFQFDCGFQVAISHVGRNFSTWFLPWLSEERLETFSQNRFLLSGVLRFGVTGGAILTRLGGELRAESLLSDLFCLLWLQNTGKVNHLMDNGFANLFFIRDNGGSLRIVNLYRHYTGGWAISAEALNSLRRWEGSDLVFYPFPVPAMSLTTRLYPYQPLS